MTSIPPSVDPVVITGIGIISPEALCLDELVKQPLQPATESSQQEVRLLANFDPQAFLGKRGFKYLSPATRYAMSATQLVINEAQLDNGRYTPEEKGVILGTNFATYEVVSAMDKVILSQGADALRPMEAPNFSINLPASHISLKHQLLAFNITLTSAIVAGLEALILAVDSIHKNRARLVLAGATEGAPPAHLSSLLGGPVAEGAACIMSLEKQSVAEQAKLPIYAQIEATGLCFAPVNAEKRLAQTIRPHLERLLVTPQKLNCFYLIQTDTAWEGFIASCVKAYLNEMETFNKEAFYLHTWATETTVSPLFRLAQTIAQHKSGLIMATSPFGHIAFLRVGPVAAKEDL